MTKERFLELNAMSIEELLVILQADTKELKNNLTGDLLFEVNYISGLIAMKR